eukprot:comp23703_c0_seq1/m.40733 comp23703_c0_seq1/g.40733  ORF comp23703_c0_seq1/g.40733 comp23703_c0_seq1/m.40733 type:complete len:345 (-) comp23703_c0_seq1:574-1608(-)
MGLLGQTVNSVVNFERSERSNGYGWATTADEVLAREKVDMAGKNVLITGGYSGIGLATAKHLSKAGAHIVLAVRDVERGKQVGEELKQLGAGGCTVVGLELESLQSVRECAREVKEWGQPIHVLICNAGNFTRAYEETEDGVEKIFQVHYLGHYLLVSLLLPQLTAGGTLDHPSRVIMITSTGNHIMAPDPADLNGKDTWFWGNLLPIGRFLAYGRAKAALLLFARELAARCKQWGLPVTSYACHPGAVDTPVTQKAYWHERVLFSFLTRTFGKSLDQAAATPVYVACSAQVEGQGGSYFSDCNRAQAAGHCSDPQLAARLWAVSQRATQADWVVPGRTPAPAV